MVCLLGFASGDFLATYPRRRTNASGRETEPWLETEALRTRMPDGRPAEGSIDCVTGRVRAAPHVPARQVAIIDEEFHDVTFDMAVPCIYATLAHSAPGGRPLPGLRQTDVCPDRTGRRRDQTAAVSYPPWRNR